LIKIKKFLKRYRKKIIFLSIIVSFSYDNSSKEVKEFDIFNQIALSLQQIARPVSKDEYENYNSQKLYAPRKAGVFAWWYQDI
jgi:hypothetical protein